jgi:hypothetical protein
MGLSERDEKVILEINEWSEQFNQYEQTDIEMTYNKWVEGSFDLIPEEIRKEFFSKVDTMLFHLQAAIQGTQIQMDARQRIITSARVFDDTIDQLADMNRLPIDKLAYLADRHIAKHRIYSLAQGGLSGTAGVLLLGTDIPTMTMINLRAVQLIAMTYGYEINTPYEMMISLKVFHAATLPKRLKHQGWRELIDEVENHPSQPYYYEGSEELTNKTWMQEPLKQLIKGIIIILFRKKVIQGVPVIGMVIGAGMNYQFTRQVTEFAHKYYQYRYLRDKEGNLE